MENRVLQYNFNRLSFVRPSLLLCKREEFRIGEEAGKALNLLFGWAMVGRLEKYKGIETKTVAKAMIEILNLNSQKIVYESDELARIALL